MNLHIVPDNVFINKFYDNLDELGVLENNRIIARTNRKLRFIQRSIPGAKLYSSAFNQLVGDTSKYENVFIHQFSPLLYRWVATQRFKKLNWMVWGADLYNLPALDHGCYEPQTWAGFVKKNQSFAEVLYKLKILLFHEVFRKKAYSKVNHVLTWMENEYAFAKNAIPTLRSDHKFFFYENQLPYQQLDEQAIKPAVQLNKIPLFIIGNSASPTLNHLEAVQLLEEQGVKANLVIPVSYGDPSYTIFLKKSLNFYTGGSIEFMERYMSFPEYLTFLSSADALIMNNIRPQGYGNILMMMYLGKKVYLNAKNSSLSDLNKNHLRWYLLNKISETLSVTDHHNNKESVSLLLSHERILDTYKKLFS